MSELKPCPFCGGRAVVERSYRWGRSYRVRCKDKGGRCPVRPKTPYDFMTEGLAVEVWNRRAEQCETANVIDRASYEEGYADGFDRGEEAVIQQVDGIVGECTWGETLMGNEVVRRIKLLIDEFWKERES